MAELVDAADSKSVAFTGVLVRSRPGAPPPNSAFDFIALLALRPSLSANPENGEGQSEGPCARFVPFRHQFVHRIFGHSATAGFLRIKSCLLLRGPPEDRHELLVRSAVFRGDRRADFAHPHGYQRAAPNLASSLVRTHNERKSRKEQTYSSRVSPTGTLPQMG